MATTYPGIAYEQQRAQAAAAEEMVVERMNACTFSQKSNMSTNRGLKCLSLRFLLKLIELSHTFGNEF